MATGASTKTRSILKGGAFALVMLAAVVGLMLWLMGYFHPKIGGGLVLTAGRPVGDAQLVPVRSIEVPVHETAVGTVRPVYETALASKILARVVAVNMTAGKPVSRGDVLVLLNTHENWEHYCSSCFRKVAQSAIGMLGPNAKSRKKAPASAESVMSAAGRAIAAKNQPKPVVLEPLDATEPEVTRGRKKSGDQA